MHRLLLLLMLLAFGATNCVAAPMALCQHVDAKAHAAALKSSDATTSAAAHSEEAAAAAEKEGALVKLAATALGGIMLPAGPSLPKPRELEPTLFCPADDARRLGLAISPLLQPPLV